MPMFPGGNEDEDFLSHAAKVHAAVQGLSDGSMDVNEIDALLAAADKRYKEPDEKTEKRLRLEKDRKGYNGKGVGINFKWYCKTCQLEFKVDLPDNKCWKCNFLLLDNETRNSQLKEKVAVLVEAKQRREKKRERMAAYKQEQKIQNKRGATTDYRAWDFWVEDSDDDELEPILPDNPAFKMMEADMDKRIGKRKEKRRKAEVDNKTGNDFFKAKNWQNAVNYYTKAIEQDKGCKKYYTNRASADLQLRNYTRVIKDCTTALEIWEYLENKKLPPKDKIVLKAYLRRSSALRGLKDYDEAKKDLLAAQMLDKKSIQIKKLLVEVEAELLAAQEEDRVEAKAAAQVMTQQHTPNENKNNDVIAATTTTSAGKDTFATILDNIQKLEALNTTEWSRRDEGDASGTSYPCDEAELVLNTLSLLLQGSDAQVYFRRHKGINIVCQIARWYESTLLHACANVLALACENTQNRTVLVKEDMTLFIWRHTLALVKDDMKSPALRPVSHLLSFLSEVATARKILLDLPLEKVMTGLFTALNKLTGGDNGAKENVNFVMSNNYAAMYIANVLSNLIFEKKSKIFLRTFTMAPHGIPTSHLFEALQCRDPGVLSSVLTAIGNILADNEIRSAFIVDEKFKGFVAVLHLLLGLYGEAGPTSMEADADEDDVTARTLAVAINCAFEAKALPVLFPSDEPERITNIVKTLSATRTSVLVRERAITLLSRAVSLPINVVPFMKANGIDILLQNVASMLMVPDAHGKLSACNPEIAKNFVYPYTVISPIARILASVSRSKTGAARITGFKIGATAEAKAKGAKELSGIDCVVFLLSAKYMSTSVANAALCIQQFAQEPTMLPSLRSAVKPLIYILRAEDTVPHQNACVALARLARDPPSLLVIREMGAMQLLAQLGSKVLKK